MTVVGSVKRYLDDHGLPYEVITHSRVFTTSDEARVVGTAASHVAKTLVIKAKEGEVLAVLPASERLDMHKLRDALGDNHARLATEDEMGEKFTEFELGAVPPLGEIFGVPVYLDEKLKEAGEVIFTGGTHSDSIKMSGENFLKLVHPQIVDLCKEPGAEMLY